MVGDDGLQLRNAGRLRDGHRFGKYLHLQEHVRWIEWRQHANVGVRDHWNNDRYRWWNDMDMPATRQRAGGQHVGGEHGLFVHIMRRERDQQPWTVRDHCRF
jgi:hypothetical protein